MFVSSGVVNFELSAYCFIWVSAVLYSISCFANDSTEYFQYEQEEFTKGWEVLSRKKDSADYEWETFKPLFIKILPFIILSMFISEVLRTFKNVLGLQLWQISISLVVIVQCLGLPCSLIIFSQPIIFIWMVQLKSTSVIWLTNVAILYLLNVVGKNIIGDNFLEHFQVDYSQSFLTTVSAFWMNLRCVCYCLDVIKHSNKPSLINLISYSLYLPLFFTGPFIQYEDFVKCYHHTEKPSLLERTLKLVRNLLRFYFWMWFLDLFLHFVYANIAGFYPKWVQSLGPWSLYGYGYTLGQVFHIKYVVFYGISTCFAQFEHIKIPTLPICIGRVHLYSDMWKYFDAGLYSFLLKYIYVPTMRRKNFYNRLFSSFLCFVFIYIWHGTQYYIFIWTLLNYIGIVIEAVSNFIHKQYLERSKVYIKLGPKWARRLQCTCATPLLMMSAISNFYFFARKPVGDVFATRLISGDFLANFVLFAVLYCCCQVSTELRSKNITNKLSH